MWHEGWKEEEFFELFETANDKNSQIKSSEYKTSGEFAVIDQSENFIAGYTDQSLKVYKGKLPVVIFGDHTRHVKLIDFPFVAGADGTQILRPQSEIDINFFYYLVFFVALKIGNYGYDRHLKHLKRYTVRYPIDLKEQVKISSVLRAQDIAIEKTEALITKYEQVKQGMMQDLFTRGVDESGTLRPTYDDAPHLYKDTPLGPLPKAWDVKELQTLSRQIIDGTHHTPNYTDKGVPFLRVTDIHDDEFDTEAFKYVSEKEHDQLIRRCKPEKDDILYSKNGTIGIPRLVTWNWEFSIFVSLALIKVEKRQIKPWFLTQLLTSGLIWDQIYRRAKQGTVTNLHLEEIREFLIPVPSSQEQVTIGKILTVAEERVRLERRNLKKLKEQKAGLMQDLLTGKVRVSVDAAETREQAVA